MYAHIQNHMATIVYVHVCVYSMDRGMNTISMYPFIVHILVHIFLFLYILCTQMYIHNYSKVYSLICVCDTVYLSTSLSMYVYLVYTCIHIQCILMNNNRKF